MDIQVELVGGKKVKAHFQGHTVLTDQPLAVGGEGAAPAPFDLFLASLATCAGFFIQSFCQKRDISTQGIVIKQVSHWDEAAHRVSKVELQVTLPEAFPEKYRAAVLASAQGCSVKKALQNPPEIEVVSS